MFATPLIIAAALGAEPVDGADLVQRVEARYAKVRTMTMAFTQTVASPAYGAHTMEGTVALARPGRMRWSFKDEGKHYIGDGSGTMWVYVEPDRQVFKYSGWTASGAESLLTSLDNLGRLFEVRVVPSDPTEHVLELIPRDKGAYERIELHLAPDLTVRSIVLADAMQTTTTMAFRDVVLDADLPPDTFTFTPPEGVEVIEATLPR